VLDWVYPQMGKPQRRQYEQAKIRALGGTADKNEKINFRYLQQKVKAQKARAEKAKEEAKFAGVRLMGPEALLARKKEKEKGEKKRQKKQRDKERDFTASVGKFKGGMLTLGSRAMKAYG